MDLATKLAATLADKSGSQAFKNTDRAYDHLRSVWVGHATVLLTTLSELGYEIVEKRADG